MESEIPSFSDDQNNMGYELPLPEAIISLMQAEIEALKQVEKVSDQLFQVLERQMVAAEALKTHIKRQRSIPQSMKKSFKMQYWWDYVASDVKAYREICQSYRTWLEGMQETYEEKMSAFKQLQEDVDNFYPR